MNYSGKQIKVQTLSEHIATRQVRLTELKKVDLKNGTAVHSGQLEAKRFSLGWFLTGERA